MSGHYIEMVASREGWPLRGVHCHSIALRVLTCMCIQRKHDHTFLFKIQDYS